MNKKLKQKQKELEIKETKIEQDSEQEFKSYMTNSIWNFWEKVETQCCHRGEKTWGYPTGFREYDELTGGLHKSELTVVAARHSMGKSSFVLNLADSLAEKKIPSLFISYDMSSEVISARLISSRSGINFAKMREGNLRAPKDYEKIIETLDTITKFTEEEILNIVPQCTYNYKKLSEEIKKFHEKHEDGVVIIDYFQLIELERKEDRYTELTNMAAAFKRLAIEINLPIVLVSQVSKKREGDKNKRPRLSDLAECDALAQHCDNLIFIYREEYYETERDFDDYDYLHPVNPEKKGLAEIIVAKHKNGPTKTCEMLFQADITKFRNKLVAEVF